MAIQINLWSIQHISLKEIPLHKDKEVNRMRAYCMATVYYGDILRLYAEDYPHGWAKKDNGLKSDIARRYWYLVAEQLMRAAANEGLIKPVKLIYHGYPGKDASPTKVQAIMAVMNTMMVGGLRHDKEILKSISHHLWLQDKLNLGYQ